MRGKWKMRDTISVAGKNVCWVIQIKEVIIR